MVNLIVRLVMRRLFAVVSSMVSMFLSYLSVCSKLKSISFGCLNGIGVLIHLLSYISALSLLGNVRTISEFEAECCVRTACAAGLGSRYGK